MEEYLRFNPKTKINLYLLGLKGYKSLKYLIQENFIEKIQVIIIGKDKNIKNDFSYEIEELCKKHRINFQQKADILFPSADLLIAISWKWLIKSDIPLIVLHDSILPEYRGFLPLVSQLIDKRNEIGVTALLASSEYDEGDIIHVSKIKIKYPIKIKDTILKINLCYQDCLKYIFKKIYKNSKIKLTPQDHLKATYSLWRDENDYFINWDWHIEKINRFIDSVGDPYKGAKTIYRNQEITIKKVAIIPDVKIVNRTNGKFFRLKNGMPIIVCRDGLLLIKEATYRNTDETIFPINSLRGRFE